MFFYKKHRNHAAVLGYSFIGLTFAVTPCVAKPVIFWASDPIEPGQTALITGAQLGDVQKIIVTRLNDDPGKTPPPSSSEQADAPPIQSNDQSVKFTVPRRLRNGVYRFTVVTADGRSSGLLNAPTIYWAQGDQGPTASPGGWIRVLGRDIARTPGAILELVPAGGAKPPIRLTPQKASLWEASFHVPASIPSGRYKLRLWNGNGDSSSWKTAGAIKVATSDQIPNASESVRDFGAKGNGRHDDTAAVRIALLHLEGEGGGTLTFPRGRYLLTGEIRVPPHIIVEGAGRNLVSLNWPEFDDAPPALIAGDSDFTIRNLTIFAANYSSVISGGFADPGRPDDAGRPANITIQDVLIRASAYRGHITPQQATERYLAGHKPRTLNGPVTIKLTGANLKILDSDIYGSGSAFYLFRPHDAYVARNKFYNGRSGWYSITGADGVIFEDNAVQGADLQSTGGGINTLSRDVAASQNVLFSGNRFSLFHGWDREAMTSDGPGGYYFGPAAARGNRRLVLTGDPTAFEKPSHPWTGAGIFIVAGRGTGEYAVAADLKGRTLTLESPLAVLPNQSSVLTIVPMQRNYLMIGNRFSDAGVAVQLYGTSIDEVVAGNISVRTGGFLDKGLIYHHFQPSWYNQFLNNRITEGNIYDIGGGDVVPGHAAIGAYGFEKTRGVPPLTRGIIIRDNRLDNNAGIEVKGGGIAGTPGVTDVVVEGNRISQSDENIVVGRATDYVLVRKNLLRDTGTNASPTGSQ